MPKLVLKKKTPLNYKPSSKEILLHKKKLKQKEEPSKYFISSGSHTLNLALTGDIDKGYCVGRMINIVGDYSTGKTLLACEACNSVWYTEKHIKGKKIKIVYDENEAAFDMDLAETFGMPIDFIEFEESETVENFHKNLYKHLKAAEDCDILLYILDSLDSLTDEAEQKKIKEELKAREKKDKAESEGKESDEKIKGDYGAKKAKQLSRFFRSMSRDLKKTNCILLIISQIRDDLKAKYGTKALRTGGKAMDFYATNVIWLDEGKIIQSATYKIPQGASIEAYVRKNKIYRPRRKARFDLLYEYGIDNYGSLIDFCVLNGSIKQNGAYIVWLNGNKHYKNDLIKILEKDDKEYKKLLNLAQETWDKMEDDAHIDRKPKWKLLEKD